MSRRQPPMVYRMNANVFSAVSRPHGRSVRSGLFAASALALMVGAGLAGPVSAQTAPATPAPDQVVTTAAPQAAAPAATGAVEVVAADRVQINRILVRGNQRIDPTTVLSYLPVQAGDVVDGAILDVAVRTLSRTGLFADVQMGVQNGDLVVEIVENPIINQVVFEGNNALSETKLNEEVTIAPRGIYTRAKIQEDVGKIVELYRLSGRIAATVTPKLVQLDQNRVDVIFEIDEGPQTGIQAITFLDMVIMVTTEVQKLKSLSLHL